MPLKLTAAATAAAVSLAEAKLHLRVDSTDDDTLIAALVAAATDAAEHLMGRAVMPQQWQLTLDSFACNEQTPSAGAEPEQLAAILAGYIPRQLALGSYARPLQLRRPPVTAVISVQYVDAVSGVLTTLASSEYQVLLGSDYLASIVPAYGKAWPATRAQPEAVQILFACGYASAAAVPDLIKAWIKLRLGALYENREQWTSGTRAAIEPNAHIDNLLDRFRVWQF